MSNQVEDPTLGGGTLELQSLVAQARNLVDIMGPGAPSAPPRTPGSFKQPLAAQKLANVAQVRDDLIDALTHAIDETNKIGKQAAATAEKGGGGMAAKARWFQLLGYLAQVLDGVCRNVELSEINERLAKVEDKLGPARPA